MFAESLKWVPETDDGQEVDLFTIMGLMRRLECRGDLLGAIQYVSGALKRFPDLHVQVEDMIEEDDKVVRNHWTATDIQSGKRLEFRGIVI